jgi:Tfp pilus assembly protein PilX
MTRPVQGLDHAGFVAPRRPAAGFALIVTIVLVAFLVLILVGLATVTRVETQVAANTQSQAQARQNALFALNLAIGQLQRHTGPDQRVTATADVLLPASANVANADTGAQAQTKLDTYWRAQRNRRWTGAWLDNAPAFDADTPAGANPAPALQGWLVSGNETNSTAFLPTDIVTGLSPTSSPNLPILDSSGRPHRLLVRASAGVTDAASLHRAVTAPQMPISAVAPGGDGTPTPIGNYAWWIGDEGVKARADLVDPYATSTPSAADTLRRAASAQRNAIEAMTSSGTDGLATHYTANNSVLSRLLNREQMRFLSTDADYPARLLERSHDLTLHSRGVLADTKNGGLKHDLSYLLSRPDVGALRTALQSAVPGSANSASYNPILTPAITRYATVPPALTSSSGVFSANNVHAGAGDYLAYSATWEQLWSYFNLANSSSATPGGAFVSDDVFEARHHNATQYGLYPILVQAKNFYRLRIVGGTPDPDGTNRGGIIWVDIIPVIVLANPYPVALAPSDYLLSLRNENTVRLYHGNLTQEDLDSLADPAVATAAWRAAFVNDKLTAYTPGDANRNLFTDRARLRVRMPEMPAGTARVFTVEPKSGAVDSAWELPAAPGTIAMVDEFDATTCLTRNTGLTIPAASTHVTLLTTNGATGFDLTTDANPATLDHRHLVRALTPHTYQADGANNTFFVMPMKDGVQQGGGFTVHVNDAASDLGVQQAPHYQVNYRALNVANAAYNSFPQPKDIARSWARAYLRNGMTGGPGNTPNPHLQGNLLFKSGSTKEVRWGVFNSGGGTTGQIVPPSLVGNAGLVNILYDVPHPDVPLNSVSRLQHFNTAGHVAFQDISAAGFAQRFATVNHPYLVNHPAGNSYPNPFVPRHRVIDGDGGMGFQYDGSWLFNAALFDRFYFSTFPGSGPFDFATDRLVNHRYRPFRSTAEVPPNDPAAFRSSSRSASRNLLVEGAFNVNSTSVEAWKALLASLRDVPTGGETNSARLSAPFARTLSQSGGALNARSANTVNSWTGTINLTRDEINALAEEITLQVRRRGPFLSLSDFVNRRLVATASDTLGLGRSGALQTAIDRVLNQAADVHADLRAQTPNNGRLAEPAFRMNTRVAGFPGYILQADLLSALDPVLSARSDTFVVRTYGDVINPATQDTEARAWCEAVVQRLPDYVVPRSGGTGDHPEDTASDPANIAFGRRYHVVSFRWLSPEDI